MKKVLLLLMMALVGLSTSAQDLQDEMPRRVRQAAPRKLPSPHRGWDETRLYPQLVVLFEFADTLFSMPNPHNYYDSVLNVTGYNLGDGPGCAAEYMLSQSLGSFHVRFDVFGPFRMSSAAQQDPQQKNYGYNEEAEALDSLFAAYSEMDYSIYDWDGDGKIEQILYICAGPGANEGHAGFIWANTANLLPSKRTPDNLRIALHSITNEGTYASKSHPGPDGFGTLLHEYSHALGLPDVYPTKGDNVDAVFSVADAWDLMDGGNFVNYGWCPPNYTAFERMYMNWFKPVELEKDTIITDLRPIEEGGDAFLIRHTENEYLLLENRQQTGWDYGVPGKGLTIWHVDFDSLEWRSNAVNNSPDLRLCLYHADNMTYVDWRSYYMANYPTIKAYALSPRMRCCLLSTSPYPWRTDSTTWINDRLTDESTPALKMYHENAQGDSLLGKQITDIQMAEDGTISFHLVVENTPTGITNTHAGNATPRKVLRDGVLYIVREEKMYNTTGSRVW